MDDQCLKEEKILGTDYFDELLERIRDIRASKKRFYQKVRENYTHSIDYDPYAPTTKEFFLVADLWSCGLIMPRIRQNGKIRCI